MRAEALIELAQRGTEGDRAAGFVLGDALEESGWITSQRVEWVMALFFRVQIDPLPPVSTRHFRSRKEAWKLDRIDSLARVVAAWDEVRREAPPGFCRAVLAVLLFETWPPAASMRSGSRCPWITMWRNSTKMWRDWPPFRADNMRITINGEPIEDITNVNWGPR